MGLGRSVSEYRRPDGTYTRNRSLGAELVTESFVASMLNVIPSVIPPGFFVGAAQRESGFASNERDTDYNEDGSVRKVTYGLYQVDQAELDESGAGGVLEDCLDPWKCHQVFVPIMEGRLTQLRSAGQEISAADTWKWLAYSHNYGLPTALSSLQEVGGVLDFNALIAHVSANWSPKNRTHFLSKLVNYANDIASKVEKYGTIAAKASGVVLLLVAFGLFYFAVA